MITYSNVNVNFGNYKALIDVSFKVKKGDFLHVVGPNGSGKSTLIKTLVGLLKPQSGKISINAVKMGYLPQKLETKKQFPMTVKEVIYSGFNKQKLKITQEDETKIKYWLNIMEIPELLNESMLYLSGGQQQRVYLIRALISQPDLLILDEPTSALDPSFREKFYTLLYDLQQEHGITLIHVTHDLTDAVKDNCKVMYVDQHIKFFGCYKDFHSFEHKEHHHD
ncbi:ATP-binding cassette domain-containing protein [Mycoplasmatota bacterium]|nr:ATP-binding cassette domain-containing protein [Mycoplasmatota bacterium]